jgi:ribonuclease-3 family protein
MSEPCLRESPDLLGAASLAFVGDCVYALLVRGYIVATHGSLPSARLHDLSVAMVCAPAQAKAFARIEPMLTEAEQAVFRRGRNGGGTAHPKGATAAEYRTATGLEALFGWLHLRGDKERLAALFGVIAAGENP